MIENHPDQPPTMPQRSSNLEDIKARKSCMYCYRMYYSRNCKYFYIILILLNVATIVWAIADYERLSGMPSFC